MIEFENPEQRPVVLVDGSGDRRELRVGEHDRSRSIRDVAKAVEEQASPEAASPAESR